MDCHGGLVVPPSSFFGPDPYQTPRLVLDPSKIVAQVNDFNAGSTLDYEVFLDGASIVTGSTVWSGTNENYLSLQVGKAS